jgi:hypothetical protein
MELVPATPLLPIKWATVNSMAINRSITLCSMLEFPLACGRMGHAERVRGAHGKGVYVGPPPTGQIAV